MREGGRLSSTKKKIQNFEIEIFFIYLDFFFSVVPKPYLISARVTTLSALRTVALRHIYLIVNYCIIASQLNNELISGWLWAAKSWVGLMLCGI